MILALCDDFSGAAEIAAVGLRFGLEAEVQTTLSVSAETDLVALDTGTRALLEPEAGCSMEQICKVLSQLSDLWIYQKVDSVLRGHVGLETAVALKMLGRRRVILVPENPSKGRIINEGRYYVNGTLLAQSNFAADPEYPATSSSVLDLIKAPQGVPVVTQPLAVDLPSSGVVVGEAQTLADIAGWSSTLGGDDLPAGGSDFFSAILVSKGFHPSQEKLHPGPIENGKKLVVCGSASMQSKLAVAQACDRGAAHCPLPAELFAADTLNKKMITEWGDCVLARLARHRTVIVNVEQAVVSNLEKTLHLRNCLSRLVQYVLEHMPLDNLVLEGGATAASIMRCMGWQRLVAKHELAAGVVELQIQNARGPMVVVKPGSYPWPDGLLSA